MHISVINGPNLNLLGRREPAIYGSGSYAELQQQVNAEAQRLGVTVEFFQSNHEGALIDAIQAAAGTADAIIINPAAYTHTSIALLDALLAVGLPAVEVHLSDPAQREEFRHVSYIRPACERTISGHGVAGYIEALHYLIAQKGN